MSTATPTPVNPYPRAQLHAPKRRRVRAIPSKELAVFSRQMSLIINSDISIAEGIDMIRTQTEDARLKNALDGIRGIMDGGISFSRAFSEQIGYFPQYLINMVTVGEESGTLDVVFAQMADYYEKDNRTRRKVGAAVTYPVILSVLMLGVIALLLLRILPMFDSILTGMGGTTPALTRGMMAFSAFLGQYILVVLIAIALLVLLIYVLGRTNAGRALGDRIKLMIPIYSMIQRRVITARFARSLAILLKSGVQLLPALETMDSLIENRYVTQRFIQARERVASGASLANELNGLNIFPPLFLRLLIIGQATGNMDEMLFKAAALFDEDVDDALEKLTTAIEPFLIIILAAIVGVILFSVMLPMINIMSSIG